MRHDEPEMKQKAAQKQASRQASKRVFNVRIRLLLQLHGMQEEGAARDAVLS
jgi:hypothetical protein